MLGTCRFLPSALLLAVTALPSAGLAQQPTKATIVQMHAVIGVGEEVFLYAVPKQLGYFQAEGLDVGIQGAQSGTVSAQVIQSGGAQLGTTAPESVLQMREQGGDLVAFYQIKQNPGTFLVVLPDSPIKRLEDLKSKTIGAPSFGAGGGLALKANLRDIGIMPDQYTALSIGAGPAAFAALVNKQVDALVTWDAMLGAAENTGLALRTVNIPLQDSLGGMTIATTESYAKSNPKALEGVCRAFTKGLHFARTNREAAIRAFWQEFPTTRPANLDPDTALKNQVHILDRFLEKAMMGVPYDGKTGVFNPGRLAEFAGDVSRHGRPQGIDLGRVRLHDAICRRLQCFRSRGRRGRRQEILTAGQRGRAPAAPAAHAEVACRPSSSRRSRHCRSNAYARVCDGVRTNSARSSGVSISRAMRGRCTTSGSIPCALAASRWGKKLLSPKRSGTAPAGEHSTALEPSSSRAGTMVKAPVPRSARVL